MNNYNNAKENLIELDEFGRIVILNQDLINQVSGAMNNLNIAQFTGNDSCGDDGCKNDAACG